MRLAENEPRARLAKCLVELSVTFAPGQEKSRRFGCGQIVNVDEMKKLFSDDELDLLISSRRIEELPSDPPVEFHVEEETKEETNDDTDRS